jgi:hypothetical protein
MRIALAMIVTAAAGCGASVGTSGSDASGDDSDGGSRADARPAADAAPPDAAPCTGGNANVVDQGTCYEAFLALPQPWIGAQSVCQGRGGSLAKIESLAENTLIAGLVAPNRAWIGGSDLASEATFVWTDGTALLAGFTHWRSGEPNNGNGNFQEDCAVIEGQNMDPTWDDRPCDTDPLAPGVPGQYFYVCER